jgi:hypothetical protein
MKMLRIIIKSAIVCVLSFLVLGNGSMLVGAKTKIMPLGDSITGTTCYPPFLWEDLMQNGDTNVVYVGTLITNGGQGVTCAGTPYYQPNEGHSGWNSSQIAVGLPGWLQQTHPDIVVMHVGTNNFWNGASQSDITATLSDYTTMVNAMRADNPNVKIIVAQIIPMDYTAATLAASNALDDAIPSWANSKTTAQSPIVVVDLRTGFDVNSYYADAANVHPNSAGSKWMADKVFLLLHSMLGGVVTGNPPAVPVLLFPPTHSINQTINPILSWSDSTSGANFRIQMSIDSLFSTTVVDNSGIATSSYSATGLSVSTKYFWRVQASNSFGTSAWSSAWAFTTGSSTAFAYLMNKGWNLVSLPIIASNPRVDHQFPYASSSAYEFVPNSGYVLKDTMENGDGYWLRFSTLQTLSMIGDSLKNDTIPVVDGWNLIGSISKPVLASSIIANGTTIVSRFSQYNGGYMPSDTIFPSKAYWIKVGGDGSLILAPSLALKSSATKSEDEINLNRLSSLVITDASGNSQRLFFGVTSELLTGGKLYEMPPRPPGGAFDVRYSTNKYVEYVSENDMREVPIMISTGAYPVSINLELSSQVNFSAILMVDGKETGDGILSHVTVADPHSRITLKFNSSDVEKPDIIRLEQNYPNPFNPSTVIRYYLPVEVKVVLRIYDVLGNVVETLVNGVQDRGDKSIEWNARTYASGMYFYRLDAVSITDPAKSFTQANRMFLIK